MNEVLNPIRCSWRCKVHPALPHVREDRHSFAKNVICIDLGTCVVFVADGNSWAANLFKARIFDPDFLRVPWVNRDGSRNVAEVVPNERQPCFMLLDRIFALPIKSGVEQRELPAR